MSSRPDLAALELLVRVAETGSLTAAARTVGMAQPNASRALNRLERQLGLTLLHRSTGGSRVTAEGEVVVAWARDALAGMERVVLGARSLAAQRAAQLRVAASMTVAEYLAPAWLTRFRGTHPDLQVSLDVGNSGHVLGLVVDGSVPVGFVESPTVPRGVASTTVARDSLVVVVAADHPWARRRTPLTPAELAVGDLVLREAGSGTRETLERALERSLAGQDLRIGASHLELASTAAVKAAAVVGTAAAVLSELAVVPELAGGQLVAVPVVDLDLSRALRAVWLPERRPTGAAAELVSIARSARSLRSARSARPT